MDRITRRGTHLIAIAITSLLVLSFAALPAAAQIETEIIAMDLVGPDPFFGLGPIHVGIEAPSMGQVSSVSGGPSFFDVFPKVTIDDCGSGPVELMLDPGEDPVHLESDIASLPPESGEEYIDAAAVTKLLQSTNPACVVLGLILEVKHSLPPGPPDEVVPLGGGFTQYTYNNSTAQVQVELDGGGLVPLSLAGPVTVVSGPQNAPALGAGGVVGLAVVLSGAAALIWRRRSSHSRAR